jgi:HAE1 family hydrophobic/amphiphilic exporter-1
MNISEPFIRRPIAASLLMAAIGFAGFVAVPFLPVAPLPQVDFPTIYVSATLQGASAETMATSVAAPLERQFGQIPGVTQLTSVSTPNASSITIQLDLNRNIDSAARARHIEEAHAAEDAKNTHIGAQSAYDMIGLCRSRGTD